MTKRRADAKTNRAVRGKVAGGCLAAGIAVGCGGSVAATAHDAATDGKQPIVDAGRRDAPVYALMAPVDAGPGYDGPVYALMSPMDAMPPPYDGPVYSLMSPVDAEPAYDGPVYALMPPMDAG